MICEATWRWQLEQPERGELRTGLGFLRRRDTRPLNVSNSTETSQWSGTARAREQENPVRFFHADLTVVSAGRDAEMTRRLIEETLSNGP